MSDAKKCDRCGAFYSLDIQNDKGITAGLILLDMYGNKRGPNINLCRNCGEELMKWLKPDEKRADTYKCYANCYHFYTRAGCAICDNKSNWRPIDE